MTIKSKEDFDFPEFPEPAEAEPDTKWFSFFRKLSEKGGVECALEGGLKGAARDAGLCKGRTAEGVIFHIWETDTFLSLKTEREDDRIVEAVSKVLGHEPSVPLHPDGKDGYVAEWEKEG
jgi:hypothetical protein